MYALRPVSLYIGRPHALYRATLPIVMPATQFRKVCRSKNSNGRPIPPVKWRTIALVNHYIKILYRPPCSRHLPLPNHHYHLLRSSRFSRFLQTVTSRIHLLILTLYGVCEAIHRTFAFICVPRSCVRTLAPRGRSIKWERAHLLAEMN